MPSIFAIDRARRSRTKKKVTTIKVVTTKKKRRKATLNTLILKAPRAMVRMKWSKNYNLNQTVLDTPVSQKFRWTSLYDPDFTSISIGDHQPWSYDTYSTLYKHYTVISATVKISAYVQNSSTSALFLTNSAVSAPANLSSYTQFMENPATSGGQMSTQDGTKVFKKTYSKNRVYSNAQNSKLLGDMGGAGTGANPFEEYYLIVSLMNIIPGVLCNDITYTVEIIYNAELTENKTLATS